MNDDVKIAIKQLRDAIEMAEAGRHDAASVFAYSASLYFAKEAWGREGNTAVTCMQAPSKVMS